MLSDIETAQARKVKPIAKIAATAGSETTRVRRVWTTA